MAPTHVTDMLHDLSDEDILASSSSSFVAQARPKRSFNSDGESSDDCDAQPHMASSDYAGVIPAKRSRASLEGVRRGKWTNEEQAYADRLIHDFEAGLLPLENGATLRAFLSKKLNCDPMRISKKFAGAKCLGKVLIFIFDNLISFRFILTTPSFYSKYS